MVNISRFLAARRTGALGLMLVLLASCSTITPYPNLGKWDKSTQFLGPVTYCVGGLCTGTDEGGQWPLALRDPPSEGTVHAALIRKAAKKYNAPEAEIVLKDVNLKMQAEINGIIRSWEGSAIAGWQRQPTPTQSEGPAPQADAPQPVRLPYAPVISQPAQQGSMWQLIPPDPPASGQRCTTYPRLECQ